MTLLKIYAALIIFNVLLIAAHLSWDKRKSRWHVNEKGQLITSKTKRMTPTQTDYNWLLAIIGSSNNDFHFSCIDKMITLFYEKHGDEGMRDCLVETRDKHWNHIHSILK